MFFAHRDSFSLLKWSPHRHILGAVGTRGQFSVYDPRRSARRCWYNGQEGAASARLLCLSWNPAPPSAQEELVAFGGQAGVVEVWNVRSGHRVCTYTGHSPEGADRSAHPFGHRYAISALAWSDDGALLASAGDDLRVHIWRPISGEVWSMADRVPLRAGCFLAWLNPRTLISSSLNCVYIWDALSGQVLREIQTPLSWDLPNAYALAPNRRHLAIASGCSVRLYDLRTGEQAGQYAPTNRFGPALSSFDFPSLVVWHPDGRRLATCFAGESNRLFLWSARAKQTLQIYQHFADITCLDWSADGKTLAWGGDGYVATAALGRATPPLLPTPPSSSPPSRRA